VSPFEDGDFSDAKFKERYNGDLANGLGNFAARVLAVGAKEGEMVTKEYSVDESIQEAITKTKNDIEKYMQDYKFHEATAALWQLISVGDKYVNEKELWRIEGSKERAATLYVVITLLDAIADLLVPFLPETAEKIKAAITWKGDDALILKKIEPLFPRLTK